MRRGDTRGGGAGGRGADPRTLRCAGREVGGGGELRIAWGTSGYAASEGQGTAPFKIAFQPLAGPAGVSGGVVAGAGGGGGAWEPARPGVPLLAVVDEEGYATLVDPGALPAPWEGRGDGDWGADAVRHQWLAHENAVFDVCWVGPGRLATASGDHSLRVWDAERGGDVPTLELRGHALSVKSVAALPTSADRGNGSPGEGFLLASGGRDGTVRLWDLRCGHRTSAPPGPRQVPLTRNPTDVPLNFASNSTRTLTTYHPNQTPSDTEAIAPVAKLEAGKLWPGRRRRGAHMVSFTSVAFAGRNLVAAGGDRMGGVHLWDLRALGSAADSGRLLGTLPQAPPPGDSRSGYRDFASNGVTSVAVDPSGSGRLLSCVYNGPLLLYDPVRSLDGPVRMFTGHQASSFFVRATFSPDGRHVASGDAGPHYAVHVWETQGSRAIHLRGHTKECSDVAWVRDAMGGELLASCGDDSTVRVWAAPPRGPPSPLDWQEQCQGTPLAAARRRPRRTPPAAAQREDPPGNRGILHSSRRLSGTRMAPHRLFEAQGPGSASPEAAAPHTNRTTLHHFW